MPNDLHNKSKWRRFKRDLYHATKGPSGTPHPLGNREYRRSKEGKLALQRMEILSEVFAAAQEGNE